MRRTIHATMIAAMAMAASLAMPTTASADTPGMEFVPQVNSDPMNVVNVDAASAVHWQICGVNVADLLVAPECDNSTASAAPSGKSGIINVDARNALHWQICGIAVLASGPAPTCKNKD